MARKSPYSLFLKIFFVLCFYGESTYSQVKHEPNNKGEILITNWNPEPEQDAAQVTQLNLKYSYNIVDGQPVGKFILQWHIGNYLYYNNKRYLTNDLSKEVIEAISIKSIKLKANVFSEDKLLTNVFIGFPDISLKGAQQLDIVNNLQWQSLFEKTNGKEATEIFHDGFELRNLLIYDVEFEGFDALADSLKIYTDKEKTEEIAPDYNQPAQLEKRAVIRKKKTIKDYFLSDFQKGKRNSFRGLSWHASFNMGLKYFSYPLIISTKSSISSNGFTLNDSLSYSKPVGGIYSAIGGEYWPLFGNYIGLGITGLIAIATVTPNLNNNYMADLGAKIFIGAKEIKLMCEFMRKYRTGNYFETNEKMFNGGKSISNTLGYPEDIINRIAFGPRYSSNIVRRNFPFENTTNYPFDAEVLFVLEKSNNQLSNSFNKIWRVNVWIFHYFNFGLELCPHYSISGELIYALESNYKDNGLYLLVFFNKTFDFFGKPYLKKKKE